MNWFKILIEKQEEIIKLQNEYIKLLAKAYVYESSEFENGFNHEQIKKVFKPITKDVMYEIKKSMSNAKDLTKGGIIP